MAEICVHFFAIVVNDATKESWGGGGFLDNKSADIFIR